MYIYIYSCSDKDKNITWYSKITIKILEGNAVL